MNKKNIMCILSIILATLLLSFPKKSHAQGNSPSDASSQKPDSMNLSTTIYANWHSDIKKDGEEQNSFEITRIHLTWKKKITDIFSGQVTTDVQKTDNSTGTDSSGSTITSKPAKEKYDVFIKFAYLQTALHSDNLGFKVNIGMVPTPVLPFLDELSGMKWVQNNMLNKGKPYTPGGWTMDYCSDLGISCALSLFKNTTIQASVVNGEGCKNVSEDDNNGKAFYLFADTKVLSSLHIYGFGKYNNTTIADDEEENSSWKDNYDAYWGAGTAWKSQDIAIGCYYVHPFQEDHGDKTNAGGEKQNIHIIDSWLNIRLQHLLGIPCFILAKYALFQDSNLDVGVDTVHYYGFGPGYSFTKGIQVAAYYEVADPNEGDSTQTFYIKTEFNF
jgi:hypothetical protein